MVVIAVVVAVAVGSFVTRTDRPVSATDAPGGSSPSNAALSDKGDALVAQPASKCPQPGRPYPVPSAGWETTRFAYGTYEVPVPDGWTTAPLINEIRLTQRVNAEIEITVGIVDPTSSSDSSRAYLRTRIDDANVADAKPAAVPVLNTIGCRMVVTDASGARELVYATPANGDLVVASIIAAAGTSAEDLLVAQAVVGGLRALDPSDT